MWKYGASHMVHRMNFEISAIYLILLICIFAHSEPHNVLIKEKPWELHPTNANTNSVHDDRGWIYPPENPEKEIKNNREIITKIKDTN